MKRKALQPFRRPLWVVLEVCLTVAAVVQIASAEEIEVLPGLDAPDFVVEDEGFIDVDPLADDKKQLGNAASRLTEKDSQILHFPDGNTLHGTLAAIDSERREIVWNRADLSTPLTLPISTVSSVTLIENPDASSGPAKATVKFSGSDWLAAEVIGLKNKKIQLRLADNSSLSVDRDKVEWIYFSKTVAPECYDGPTSMAGWISDGSWTFQEGALRASRPGPIGRFFEALPDRVEYFFELNQNGDFQAFSINLRGTQVPSTGVAQGRMQVMFTASDLRLWAQIGEEMKMEQVDLRKALGAQGNPDVSQPPRNKAVQYRLLEDFPGGRLIVFINGRKAAEWKVAKGEAGKHRGGFTFQPMVWNADSQQTISHVRVVPWDGVVPADGASSDRGSDSVMLSGGELKRGDVAELSPAMLKLGSGNGPAEIPREQVTLVHFRRAENPPDEDAPVAHLRLARRGEFDVSGISLRGRQITAQTSFGGELALPLAALRTVEVFGSSTTAGAAGDVLVFKNGDRLKGTLEGIANDQPIRWRAAGTKAAIDIHPGKIMGVLLAPRAIPAAAKSRVVARFHNGDLLSGEFVGLTGENLQLNSTQAGSLTIARSHLQNLYFSSDGVSPVLDGATGADLWMSCAEFRKVLPAVAGGAKPQEAKKTELSSLWHYFDGAFTFQRPQGNGNNAYNRSGVYLGRIFEAMPQSVEISFQVSTGKIPAVFSIQLFSEPNKPGYMMQCYSEGIFLHDMAPRGRNRAVFQQQFTFEDKVPKEATQRQIRILADRPSGKVTFVVDGVVVGQVLRKPGDGDRNLGRGFMILPQTTTTCTFSDLWIGPWSGQIPGKEPAGASEQQHSVLLANGDESRGTVQTASPESVKFESEVGLVELPTSRLMMLDFGRAQSKAARGARLRLSDSGSLTVSSYRVENGNVICQSAIAGELKLPLTAVQEIALTASQAKDSDAKKR